ncbi:MAG: GAF domain-containing protein [Anaerolineales bacterium]
MVNQDVQGTANPSSVEERRGRRFVSIRQRLLLAFIALPLITLTAVGIASAMVGLRARTSRAVHALETILLIKDAEVGYWLQDLRHDFTSELGRKETRNTLLRLLQEPEGSAAFLEAHNEQLPRFQTIILLQESFVDFFVLNGDGKVLLSTNAVEEGRSYAGESFFQTALQGPVVSPPMPQPGTDEPAITLAWPVLGSNGQLLGVFAGRASLESLDARLSDVAGLEERVSIFLVSEEGGLLTFPGYALPVAYTPPELVVEGLAVRGNGWGRYTTADGEDILGVYRWVPELDALLVAEQDEAQLQRGTAAVILVDISIMIVCLILAVVAALVLSRNLTEPLLKLADAVESLAAGELRPVSGIDRKDEIGVLARAFNQMAERITVLIATLERRVTERTHDLEKRTQQLSAAAQVSRLASSQRDVHELMDAVALQITNQFDFYHIGIFLVDQKREYAVLQATASEGGRRMRARRHRLRVGVEGIVGYVAQAGSPRIALDVGQDPHFFDNPDLPETRSEMALPLKVGGEVVGVLDVQSREPRAFSEPDVAILQTMADQIALAMENARLLEGTRQRLREIALLLGERVRQGWSRMSEAHPDWGFVYDGVDVRALDEKRDQATAGAQIEIPLEVRRGQMIGRLRVRLGEAEPSPETVALTRAIARQTSLALENARLFQETQATLEDLEVLYAASEDIGAAHAPDEVLQALVDHVLEPGIDRALLVVREELREDQAPRGLVAAVWQRQVERVSEPHEVWDLSQVPFLSDAELSDPIVISDVATNTALDEEAREQLLRGLGITAMAILPLRSGGRLFGWILLGASGGPYYFSGREIRLYRTLSDPAAVALENIRLIEASDRRAKREQMLADLGTKIRASADPEVILKRAVQEMRQVLNASSVVIHVGGDGFRQVGTPEEEAE